MNATTPTDRTTHGSRFDWEADDFIRGQISAIDLSKSPEEYAARHAHDWGLFSYHLCRFRDPALAEWIRRFAEIFESAEERDRRRAEFLSPEEIAVIRQEEAEGL